MNILVTGAAGFIGSHLCERLLLDENNIVFGIDGLIDLTLVQFKQRNLTSLINHPRFSFKNENLLTNNLEQTISNIDVIYHLAAIPGVRSSWGSDFNSYVINNIQVTQRLLEACRNKPIKKFIYISTSSVYGEKIGKVAEGSLTTPLSPYGVTKLTGEYLCKVYEKNFNVPIIILRYFTIYGPRQRSDMAFHRFIKQVLLNKPLTIFGTGKQTRDFTYISDCVEATSNILYKDHLIGETINIGGKERASILEVIAIIEEIVGTKVKLQFIEKPHGEPLHTWADISKAERLLQYQPIVHLKQGIKHEFDDLKKIYMGGG